MALIKSLILSAIRGSVNGMTFSQNRYGAYARNRTVPVNPNTLAQQNARAGLANSSLAWKALTEPQRQAWNNYAAETPVPNRLGDMVTLSGIAMFNKTNAFQLFIGDPIIEAAPPTPGLATPLIINSYEIDDQGSLDPNSLLIGAYDNGDTSANSRYAAWVSSPLTAGKTFFNGPWHYVGLKTGATRNTFYQIPFVVETGQIFFFRVRYCDAAGKLAKDLIVGPVTALTNS
jgi:hypothetical protein